MRPIWLALAVTFAIGNPLGAQTVPAQPQTARQALIEMFMSKNQEDFAKHLPEAARQALIHKGETQQTSFLLRMGMLGRGMVGQSQHMETFNVGPNLLVSDRPDQHERLEVAVEHDSLMGEQDEIELSVHNYKDGEEQPLPVVPRLIFTLSEEKEIWRLTEVTVAAHVPLTDPDYLKGLRKQQNEANESAAQMRMNMIISSQATYEAAHPETGYTCAVTSLTPDVGEHPPASAPNDAGEAGEDWNGYRFTLSGCGRAPSTKYRLAAVPIDPDAEEKTFCADQSGKLKFVIAGVPQDCFSSGQVVDSTPPYPAATE
jgi:hypothetical protein